MANEGIGGVILWEHIDENMNNFFRDFLISYFKEIINIKILVNESEMCHHSYEKTINY